MRMLIVVLFLTILAVPSHAMKFVGKLDLSPAVSPIMIREIHDGQWLAGVVKENLWHLDQVQADGSSVQRLHAGVFQAWNAEKGNASMGMVAGIDLPVGLGAALQNLGTAFGLEQSFKPLSYFGAALSLDAIGGYRPVHSSDVHSWVYGVGARLNVAFGVSELKKGL